MTAKTIVITGASDGIGAAAARRLRRAGEHVVVIGRSETKTHAVAAELDADCFVADFADLAQVRALAEKLRTRYPRIDVLANNAGGMTRTIRITNDGYEHTYQVNYLAPFLLTTQLMEVLVESRASIVNTTSSSQSCWARSASTTFTTRTAIAPAPHTPSPSWQSSCSPRNYIVDTMVWGVRGDVSPRLCRLQLRSCIGVTGLGFHAAPAHHASGCDRRRRS